MDLRTRYTALVTLTTQHVKYISDALRRLEEEEVRAWGALFPHPLRPQGCCSVLRARSRRCSPTLEIPFDVVVFLLPPLFAESGGGGEAGARGQGEGAPGLGPGLEAERAGQDSCCWEQRAGRHREIHLGAAGKAGVAPGTEV